MTRTQLLRALAAVSLPALTLTTATTANAADTPHIGHVWTIVLENSEMEQTYIADRNSDPYLSQTLTSEGMFIPGYFGTGHSSLDNYIAMVSGQGPNAETKGDCHSPTTLGGGSPNPAPDASGHTWHFDADGQAIDDSGAAPIGCTYPAGVKNISDQLQTAGISWKGYMENMDAQNGTRSYCSNPYVDTSAVARTRIDSENPNNPNYKTKHNPFAYFHSLIDQDAYCQQHVVPLGHLDATGQNPAGQLIDDLGSLDTTPQYSFITPDQCHDGHDSTTSNPPCPNAGTDGYAGVDEFLKAFVPAIMNSAAYEKDGLIVIITDEGDTDLVCCGEKKAPNLASNDNNGNAPADLSSSLPVPDPVADGGGETGAVLLSPFIKAGSVDAVNQFNHYSYLRSMEDLFGLSHLGYAAASGLMTFQDAGDVPAGSPTPALPEAPMTVLLAVVAAGALALTLRRSRRQLGQ